MSSRLSAVDRRQQILHVATGLFARKGYEGTTTREIAEEAGVNEALLFRHFPTKENLYWMMIEELCNRRGRRERVAKILENGETDFEVFRSLAREFLDRSPRDRELTRLLWFTALENHELSERFFHTFIADYFETLARYIRGRIRHGAFRKTNPLLAARGFIGMVVYHFLVQELFSGEQHQNFESADVADTLASIWLSGMQAGAAKLNGNGTNRNHLRAGSRSHNGN